MVGHSLDITRLNCTYVHTFYGEQPPKSSFTRIVYVCFCVCDATSLPLLSVVLFTLSDDKYLQTSKQTNANGNVQC